MSAVAPGVTAAVVVTLADLSVAGPLLEAIDSRHGMLAPDEENRALAIEPMATRVRWRMTRVLLRLAIFGEPELVSPAERRRPFSIGPNGRPTLPPPGPAFSLSHSGDWAAVAVAPEGPLGLDIEDCRRVRRFPPERRRRIVAAGRGLAGDATGPDTDHVLTHWTRLEALAKARGDGIWPLLAATGVHGRLRLEDGVIAARTADAARRVGVEVCDLPDVAATTGSACVGAVALPAVFRGRYEFRLWSG